MMSTAAALERDKERVWRDPGEVAELNAKEWGPGKA
jgi:hypothetical protein